MALINIAGKSYELILENKAGWNLEAFKSRYSEVLERYDYIIGDWGYNQLRLKGFFKEGSNKATKESTFSFATDYINEYCNFGCAYFILEKKFDNNVQVQDEVDPLLVDLEEEYDFNETDEYQSAANETSEYDSQEKPAQVEVKTVKVQHTNYNQHKQAQDKQGNQKGQDKQQKRRPFKPRHNNKNNQNSNANQAINNVANQDDTVKEVSKKSKRRHNRPFRHFDRKKNKEQASAVKE